MCTNNLENHILVKLRGQGGPQPWEGQIWVFVCFWQRSIIATRNFLRNQKILLLAREIGFLNLENTYNYITRAIFNPNYLQMCFLNLKIYLLLHFLTLRSINWQLCSKDQSRFSNIDFFAELLTILYILAVFQCRKSTKLSIFQHKS